MATRTATAWKRLCQTGVDGEGGRIRDDLFH